MVPVPVIKTRVAVARNVCFVPTLPISSPEDMDCDLPLEEDHPELWPRSTKEIGRYNLKLYLEEAPRACGVLVDGTVYSDDRIFWFDGILKSTTEYPLVYEKPHPSDLAQLRRDKLCGVKYAVDFPQADDEELSSDIPIIYLNEKTWMIDRAEQIEYCRQVEEFKEQELLDDSLRVVEESFYGKVLRELNMTIYDPRVDKVSKALRDPLVVAAVLAARSVQERLDAKDAAQSAEHASGTSPERGVKRVLLYPFRTIRRWFKR